MVTCVSFPRDNLCVFTGNRPKKELLMFKLILHFFLWFLVTFLYIFHENPFFWMSIMLVNVSFSICSIKVTLSTSNKYTDVNAFHLHVHRGSQCPRTSRSSRAWRDSTQHLSPVVKMTQHQGCFCPVIGSWRLVCCSVFSSKLCQIPYPKYMVNPSREMRRREVKAGALLTYKCQ